MKRPKQKKSPLRAAFEILPLVLTALVLAASALLITQVPARRQNQATPTANAAALPDGTPTVDPTALDPLLALPAGGAEAALVRNPEPFTVMPERERTDLVTYAVQEGDTVFGIADKFELSPESIFWGNPGKAKDLQLLWLGMEMNILPVDGVLHVATGQQSIQSIATRYGVDPYDIIFSEYNSLSADTTPQTKPPFNTLLIIPGGEGEALNVGATVQVQGSGVGGGTVTVSGGGGSCGPTKVTTVGRGVFGVPLAGGYTFMQDFYPGIHNGVDLAGSVGDGVVAADSGTVVFAGSHSGGYGYLVVIDHGNGFQTYYAHLSRVSARCGAGVSAGQRIGSMGCTGNCTGPHLHFEIQQGGVPTSPTIHIIL